MTPDQTERVARWWAERLGDSAQGMCADLYSWPCAAGGKVMGQAAEYLNDMNTARRAREWADEQQTEEMHLWKELLGLKYNAWIDTPDALHDLAVACGMNQQEN